MSEREEFEAWYARDDASKRSIERDRNSEYLLMQAGSAWRVWQARAALSTAPTTGSAPQINQCDGCSVDAPITERGNHAIPDGGFMGCTKERYAAPTTGSAPGSEPWEMDWPQYSGSGMGCGLEDRGIYDPYDAMRYGWDEAMEQVACVLVNQTLYAVPTPITQVVGVPVAKPISELEAVADFLEESANMSVISQFTAIQEWIDLSSPPELRADFNTMVLHIADTVLPIGEPPSWPQVIDLARRVARLNDAPVGPAASVLTDEQISAIVDEFDACHWVDGECRIEGRDMMKLCRALLAASMGGNKS